MSEEFFDKLLYIFTAIIILRIIFYIIEGGM